MSQPVPAIQFHPDGYALDTPHLMGRQAAGNAFLRAAVEGRGDQPLTAVTVSQRGADVFTRLVQGLDAAASTRWVPADRPDLLAHVGGIYLPDPNLARAANMRLRTGPGAYSITGVTHTTASHAAMDHITSMLAAPVMPWDALICTSTAVGSTVRLLLERQRDYLRWRFGSSITLTLPQLPIIPLGVHCADFDFHAGEREAARKSLGIAEGEVVALFVGRLSFHAKAHPHAMYAGLAEAVRRSGKAVTLLQCGWFANSHIEGAFKDGLAQFGREVRGLFADGRDPATRRRCWASADLFISLSDNIQETFGLTPLEAKAAGLPVVVTDWDGYRDTVRDGIDGFRIPTWMPPADLGEVFARSHEADMVTYDMYCGETCQAVSVDGAALADRLTALVTDRDLRLRMGAAGRHHAREAFDWAIIWRRYRMLWWELERIRQSTALPQTSAPRSAPARPDPFAAFGHYPTEQVLPQTLVFPGNHAEPQTVFDSLSQHALFRYADRIIPLASEVESIIRGLAGRVDGRAIQDLTVESGIALPRCVMVVAVLAKMGLVRLSKGIG
ncbi:MAG: hypothetical protein RLY86_2235 [Pseudomonadota bacterium]|jgi:glycosyltransferase involved in cell wall biosynthesis